jgi:hypothetical protein
MSELAFIIRFYLVEPGDLGIQDVQWGGHFADAKAWARQRLDSLRSSDRPADQLRPATCDILEPASEQPVYSFTSEMISGEPSAAAH